MDDLPVIKAEDVETDNNTPEHRLLREVFLRALGDLGGHVEVHVRRDAILWFEDIHAPMSPDAEDAFSFKYVCEIFDFTDRQIRKILERVEVAKALSNNMQRVPRGYRFKAHSEIGYSC